MSDFGASLALALSYLEFTSEYARSKYGVDYSNFNACAVSVYQALSPPPPQRTWGQRLGVDVMF